MPHYISRDGPITIIPQPPTHHQNYYQHSKIPNQPTPAPCCTHHRLYQNSSADVHYQFQASTQGRYLRHSEAECRHPANPLEIHGNKIHPPPRLTPARPLRRCQKTTKLEKRQSHSHTNNFWRRRGRIIQYIHAETPGKSGRILLDTTASPTYNHLPVKSMALLPYEDETCTATNDRTNFTHAGTACVRKTIDQIITSSVVSPSTTENLIFVREIKNRNKCWVTFMVTSAHIVEST